VRARRAHRTSSSCLAKGKLGVPSCDRPIQAHSITRSRDLAAIAQEGHVVSLAEREKLHQRKGTDITEVRWRLAHAAPRRVGLRKASVFLGLCARHDNLLFQCIEDQVIQPTCQQRVSMMLRPALLELHRKKEEIAGLETVPDPIRSFLFSGKTSYVVGELGDSGKRRLAELALEGLSAQALDALERKIRLSSRHVVIRSSARPQFHFASAVTPIVDLHDTPLQDLHEPGTAPDLLLASSWNDEGQFSFMISATTDSVAGCRIIDQALELSATEAGQRLTRLIFKSTENIMVAPDWWSNLEPDVRRFALMSTSPLYPLLTRVGEGPSLLGSEPIALEAFNDD
jgi:hypothetical protein